eukprot:CAMPEP_0182479460 /NCGR_PEP_ID=MMETSP1319-20130603/34197_1 /TAXON_ID=172717 /ORGANISM="Bolidomonas pacifica, Strain RCC208" /LENGTH=92 /DNA_ID=CAMNT_0024680887 /DNA_START=57 /DNA_END=331 /DNA_ORIENTATION=+
MEAPEASGPSARSVAKLIDGIHTEVVVNIFSDRIFVIITQTGKMGTLLQASSDHGDVDVRVLMGRRDDPLLVVYAQQLVESLRVRTESPILL